MIEGNFKKPVRWWIYLPLAGLLLAPAMAAGAPDGEAARDYRVSDAGLFQQELQACGALKFCDNTEDLLRAGHFERALLRYYFLKRQISPQPGYQPLVHLINQRLDFLKEQLKLPAADYAALHGPRIRKMPPTRTQAAPTPPPDQPAPTPEPAAAGGRAPTSPVGEGAAPSTAAPSPALEDLAAAPAPSITDSPPKPGADQVQEEKPPEAPPSPPPSRWQRLKRRLWFWRR
ncbi:MAG: hypothetical protein QME75_11335 [Deltaproteobacteria bacterium]|nr:hypothetical protein [Deltaproteobacteria bacterium]